MIIQCVLSKENLVVAFGPLLSTDAIRNGDRDEASPGVDLR